MRASRFFVLKSLAAGLLLLGSLFSVRATAQDFHVETTLFAVGRSEPKELMRSITLFHAGKTYDFIPDLGELIIFDPSHGQFALISTRQRKLTEVHIDEINRMLGIARQTLNDRLQRIQADPKADQNVVEQILFQFNPQFDKQVIQTSSGPEVDLRSKFFNYQVLGATTPTPTHVFAYLNYADWICRLNYVLNPGGILPDQRLALDAALREANLVPIQVNFNFTSGEAPSIKAMHRIYWELNDRDRELVRQWDSLQTQGSLKRVTFLDYQRALVASQPARRK
ncbi:MAG TPA: hypothetical protein VFG04_10335 [Planctomycetaceae bacterium]|nr:hypothetical protein [Planctomycetaceae bacterium]